MGVSVVIPCHQSAATLERAVASVLDQTMPASEIVVVDDASRDGTRALLRSLRVAVGGRLRVIELDRNVGPASARNIGWEAARHELIAFLDADDAWHRRKLEIQLALMHENADYALTGHRHAMPGRIEPDHRPRVRDVNFRSLLLRSRFPTSSVILRRALPQRFAEGERYGEDYLLWLQIAAAGHRIAVIDAPLVTRFQPTFGGKGLSGYLWHMESAELRTYRSLRAQAAITMPTQLVLQAWSFLRFARRLALVWLRRLSTT